MAGAPLDVWLGDPAVLDDARRAAALALLDPDELARMERYHFERDRLLHVASHSLLRTTLSRYASIAPHAWRYRAEPSGRPVLAGPEPVPRLHFNLSHCNGLVACAVTDGVEVGVDVEPIGLRAELIDEVFSTVEARALRALPAELQPERFATLWTLKEAYIKARGDGLALPLREITFHLDDGAVRMELGESLCDTAASWTIASLRPTPRHCAAVCVRRSGIASDHVFTSHWTDWNHAR